jgi:hypothetical protein
VKAAQSLAFSWSRVTAMRISSQSSNS